MALLTYRLFAQLSFWTHFIWTEYRFCLYHFCFCMYQSSASFYGLLNGIRALIPIFLSPSTAFACVMGWRYNLCSATPNTDDVCYLRLAAILSRHWFKPAKDNVK